MFPSIHSQARSECGIETEKRLNVLHTRVENQGERTHCLHNRRKSVGLSNTTADKLQKLVKLESRQFDGIFLYASLCTCKSSTFFTSSPYLRTERLLLLLLLLLPSNFLAAVEQPKCVSPSRLRTARHIIHSRARPPPLRPWLLRPSTGAETPRLERGCRVSSPRRDKRFTPTVWSPPEAPPLCSTGRCGGEGGGRERGRAFPPLLAPPNPNR